MSKETIFERIIMWLRVKILCNVFGLHKIVWLFVDDEEPNFQFCLYCGKGSEQFDRDC